MSKFELKMLEAKLTKMAPNDHRREEALKRYLAVQMEESNIFVMKNFETEEFQKCSVMPEYGVTARYETLQNTAMGHFVAFTHVPMIDWDWPDVGHIAKTCITIKDFGDVVKRCQETYDRFGITVRLYVTPGGIRGWVTGEQHLPKTFYGNKVLQDVFQGDPLYAELALKKGRYWARLSPKPSRPGEWVAHPTLIVGDTSAERADSADLVNRYHDGLIKVLLENTVNTEWRDKVVSQQLDTIKSWSNITLL